MSHHRRVHQTQSADNISEFSRLENKCKIQNFSVSKSSASYPYRSGEPDCSYYLRTGWCGYGSNCRFNHPDDQGSQYREQLPGGNRRPNCLYFLRTGTCKYGSTCKYLHPMDRNGARRVTSNIRGHPIRQDQMEKEQSEFRSWDEIFPEALELIFSHLSLKELLIVIPRVGKYWRNVVTAPDCWREIDIEQWSKYCRPRRVDRMLRMLITRSNGCLRKLCVSGITKDDTFSFITENASSLQVLRLPGSKIRGSIVEKTAQRLSTITLLDLSCCEKIGARGLGAIGKHCKLLDTLLFNMDSMNFSDTDAEANAIAATMPRLKHLELANHEFSSESVMKIIFGCPQLEYLNIKYCPEVELDFGFLKEKFPKLTIFGPYILEDFNERDLFDDVFFFWKNWGLMT